MTDHFLDVYVSSFHKLLTKSFELTSCKHINTGKINVFICIQLGSELKKPKKPHVAKRMDNFNFNGKKLISPQGADSRNFSVVLSFFST